MPSVGVYTLGFEPHSDEIIEEKIGEMRRWELDEQWILS